MRELLAELLTCFERRRTCVYCSVVETRGSTPQKAGAVMLVFPDGSQSGTLGGGCVEAEVKQRSLLALHADGGPQVFTFHLDDDYGWDDGLICGGRMMILAHPLGDSALSLPSVPRYYRRLQDLVQRGEGFTESLVIAQAAGTLGDRYLFDENGRFVESLGGTPSVTVAAGLVPLSARPQPSAKQGLAYLPTLPRVALLLVGGGHVGQAVAKLAAEVDFEIWVVDDREKYVSAARFPTASRRIVGEIGPVLRDLAVALTPSVFALILTRGHNHDEEALFHLAPTASGYVGMIGSRRKIRLIFDDLEAKGISAEALAKVHAPLGFHIGSQTVPEIAVSIVAELIACRNLGETRLSRQSWKPDRADR